MINCQKAPETNKAAANAVEHFAVLATHIIMNLPFSTSGHMCFGGSVLWIACLANPNELHVSYKVVIK